ncbi:MAG: Imm7 family immunity protein, partial [Bacteroidota bacterium]
FYENDKAKEILDSLNSENGVISNKVSMNGEVGYQFYINHNRFGFSFKLLLEKLEELIITQSPELHGLLYLFDDEDETYFDTWQVWIISKGKIIKEEDIFLSPYSKKVADYEDDNG